MKKRLKVVNVDCADCAQRMENKIKNIAGVSDAKLNFLTQKLVIEAEDTDFENIIREADKCISSVDTDAHIDL